MMPPRLILHTRVVRGSGGGPDKTILHSGRFLEGTGYRVLCAYMRDPRDHRFTELEARAHRMEVPFVAVDDAGPFDRRVARRMRLLCDEYRPALWHGHDYKSNWLGLVVGRRFTLPLVTTVHGWVHHTWKTPLYHAVDRYCLRRYERVICVSEDLRETCLRLGVPEERCAYIPNAVDTEEFRPPTAAERSALRRGVPPGRLVVGAVGRLSREKGFDLLLRALGKVRDAGVEAELWIVGEGERRAELERLAGALEIADRVRFLGYRSDMPSLFRALDAFALSSLREGLPNVLLEALATGLPVAATRVAGVPRVVEDGEEGLLVDPGSAESLAQGLGRLLGDAALRRRLGCAARRKVETSYSFAHRMERIREIYDSTLATSGEALRGGR